MDPQLQLLYNLKAAYTYLRNTGRVHTQKDLANAIGWRDTHLSTAMKGNPERLTKGLMEAIWETYPFFNIHWLLTGKGEMLKDNSDNIEDIGKSADSGEIIPLLPVEAMAGGLQYLSRGVVLADCRKIVSPVPGADFAIQVSGDSMEPEIHDGTYIYIKKINEKSFIPWGNTMVVDTENGVVVKKLFPIENDEEAILAKSVNPAYPPFKIPTDSIFGIYRVLGGSFFVSTL